MNVNLYRKYRPSNFEEIVGQEVVVKTLSNAIKNDQLAHAYLFCGIRGTGKTSLAKIFARAINCESKDNILLDNCSTCQNFLQTTDPTDIFEIDAASNNGVEEIRKIIDNVKYMPINLKYKVYIIDEVHMLSKGAFNALLKTLEEPPKNVVFILATTNPNKIPLTILSRVQRFDFRRIESDAMKSHLQKVLKIENIEYDDEGLDRIVLHAQGGLRDAFSLTNKIIAFGGKVTSTVVNEALNLASNQNQEKILSAIINYQPDDISQIYHEIIQAGVDEVFLLNDLIEMCKHKLLVQNDLTTDQYLHYLKIIKKLMECEVQIKQISNSILYIEITLIELAMKKTAPQPVATPVEQPAFQKPEKKVSDEEQRELLNEQLRQLKASEKTQSEPVVNNSNQMNFHEEETISLFDVDQLSTPAQSQPNTFEDLQMNGDAGISENKVGNVEVKMEVEESLSALFENAPAKMQKPATQTFEQTDNFTEEIMEVKKTVKPKSFIINKAYKQSEEQFKQKKENPNVTNQEPVIDQLIIEEPIVGESNSNTQAVVNQNQEIIVEEIEQVANISEENTEEEIEQVANISEENTEEEIEQVENVSEENTEEEIEQDSSIEILDNEEYTDQQVDEEYTEQQVDETDLNDDEPIIEESIISSITNKVVAKNLEKGIEQIVKTTPQKPTTNVTPLDVLLVATKEHKSQFAMMFNQVKEELKSVQKYGLASFFEEAVVQGASELGCITVVKDGVVKDYDQRLNDISQALNNKFNTDYVVFMYSETNWRKERPNFVQAIKNKDKVDIFTEAQQLFGVDKVNKIN